MVGIIKSPHLVLWSASLLLVLPAIVAAPMMHDSFWIDWVWADQFTAELAQGNLYPRWLPRSHGGLGSPVFYFYPPLAFYVSGAFGLSGLSTYASIVATFWVALLGSGYAMYLWLRGFAPFPLLGAFLYMAAPYHLFDFYGRGAQAEFLAIAFIPLVAWSMREDRRAVLAVSYAGLILSHLPLALLVSLFLVAPYAVYLRKPFRFAAPLMLGIGLSAMYLWPAFTLERYRDAASLWTNPHLQPEHWGLFAGNGSWARGIRFMFAAILLSSVPVIAAIYFSGQRSLAIYAAICCAVAAGFVPGIWSLPLIAKVQFPFRLLPIVEFALATGTAMFIRSWLLLVWFPALLLSAMSVLPTERQIGWTIADLSRLHPDVPENLPPGDRPFSWPSRWALATAVANPGAILWFPSWRTACRAELLIPARCAKRLEITKSELVGLLITLLSFALLFYPAVKRGVGHRLGKRRGRSEKWRARLDSNQRPQD